MVYMRTMCQGGHASGARPAALLAVLFVATMAGCGLAAQPTIEPGAGSSDSQAGPPPVVLADTSPGQLDLHIGVTMGGYEVSSRETTVVAIHFSSGDRSVKLVADEHLSCNGTEVPRTQGFFGELDLPTAAVEGKTLTCTYTSGATSASISTELPHAPRILSPTEGAQLVRNRSMPIHFQVDGGQLMGLVALGPSSKAIARLDPADPSQATVDTSTFKAGPGSLALTQQLAVSAQAPQFKSFTANGTGMTAVDVTWV